MTVGRRCCCLLLSSSRTNVGEFGADFERFCLVSSSAFSVRSLLFNQNKMNNSINTFPPQCLLPEAKDDVFASSTIHLQVFYSSRGRHYRSAFGFARAGTPRVPQRRRYFAWRCRILWWKQTELSVAHNHRHGPAGKKQIFHLLLAKQTAWLKKRLNPRIKDISKISHGLWVVLVKA